MSVREESSQTPSPGEELTRRRLAWRRLPNRLFAFLLAGDTFFVGVFVLAILLGFAFTKSFDIVNLDAETNPASWWSATQLFLPAIAFLFLGSTLIPTRRRASVLRRLWLVLGFSFVYLSMDEGGEIHERLGHILTRLGLRANVNGGGQWVFFYLIILAVLLIVVRKDIPVVLRNWRTESLLFALGFVVLAIGEIGFEFMEIIFKWHGYAHLVEIGFEEGIAMVGGSILAYAAWRVLGATLGSEPDAEEEVAGS